MTEPVIESLRPEHAGELFTVQRAAYVTEAQLYREPNIPPLTETLDQVRADLADPAVPVLGAWLGSRLVGSVRGRPDGDRMEVARFAVAPDQQGRGIGGALLAALEAEVPASVRTLWLLTGARSTGNIRLYQRLGYQEIERRADSVGVGLVVLAKAVAS